eukprot:COSAG02_NODE_13054_length_1452_cov_1.325203_1_plen_328_part_10
MASEGDFDPTVACVGDHPSACTRHAHLHRQRTHCMHLVKHDAAVARPRPARRGGEAAMMSGCSPVALALSGVAACGVAAVATSTCVTASTTPAPAGAAEEGRSCEQPPAKQQHPAKITTHRAETLQSKRLTALGLAWAQAAAVDMSHRTGPAPAPALGTVTTVDDPWTDESDEEPPSLVQLPSGNKPPVVSDGPFTVGVAVQCDRSRLQEFATHGRRNGWFGLVVLLAPPGGGAQELLVLAAQKWQTPDSTEFLAALCSFLQDEGAAFFSAERSAVVQVSPLPPFCMNSAEGTSEDFVVGRLGLTIETPLTASMVDVGATDVLNSMTT